MRDLGSVAETFQKVQRARKRFLEMWSVENDYIKGDLFGVFQLPKTANGNGTHA